MVRQHMSSVHTCRCKLLPAYTGMKADKSCIMVAWQQFLASPKNLRCTALIEVLQLPLLCTRPASMAAT